MRIPLATAAVFPLLAAALPAQELHLQMTTSLGTAGRDFCKPVACVPMPLGLPRGGNLGITTMGAPFQPHLLLVAPPPAQCATLPGVAGPLIVQGTAAIVSLSLAWGRFYVSSPGQPFCGGWMGFGSVTIPASAPVGAAVVMQLAAPTWNGTASQWTLSDAAIGTFR